MNQSQLSIVKSILTTLIQINLMLNIQWVKQVKCTTVRDNKGSNRCEIKFKLYWYKNYSTVTSLTIEGQNRNISCYKLHNVNICSVTNDKTTVKDAKFTEESNRTIGKLFKHTTRNKNIFFFHMQLAETECICLSN